MRCAFASTAFSLLAVGAVYGDGMMTVSKLGQSVDMVESPKQEALIVLDSHARTTTVSLRTHFRPGPTDLAWVIPVPATPENIQVGNEEVFRALQAGTTPEFWVITRTGPKFGCGGNSQNRVLHVVDIVDAGTAGIFDYVVLNASDNQALVRWLNENDYLIPNGADPVIGRYVDLGWHWLAIRLRAEFKDQPSLAPHPITYSYRRTKLEYPLVISRLSATNQIELVLYVLADCEYGGENWANAEIDSKQLVLDTSTASGTNYEAVFRQLTADNGGHLLVTEFASDLDTVGHRPLLAVLRGLDSASDVLGPQEHAQPSYLSRLRAVIDKDKLDRDVVLVPTRVSEYDFVLNSHQISAPSKQQPRSTAWLATVAIAVVLAVLYHRLRRRPRHAKTSKIEGRKGRA